MIDLRALLASGELHRIAQQCRDQKEFADRLGVTPGAYRSKVARLRHGGVSFPTYEQLRGHESSHVHDAELGARLDLAATPAGQDRARELLESRSLSSDFADEEPTQPGEYRDLDTAIDKSIRPPLPPMPPGHLVRGVSTLVDSTGAITAQWIKTHHPEQQRIEAVLAALPGIIEPFRGLADPVDAPEYCDDDLMNVFVMGDPHLGAHAWGEETGENFDLQIAERELVAAVDHLVAVAPRARRAVVLDLGDFFDFDNVAQTTTRGTRQDGDTRWAKVLRTGLRAMRRCVDRTLETHMESAGVVVPGNHDFHTSTAMALALEQFYEREPRVSIDTTPDPFKWIRWGGVLIMATHGEEIKAEGLMGVMATDRRAEWGECSHCYILTGHVHHSTVKELPGVTVETFPTLASRTAWAHKKGYRAQQTMCVDTFHKRFGRVNRSIIGVQQVRAMLNRDA